MRFYLILFFATCFCRVYGQQPSINLTGQVTFISSQNIYVRFISTKGIAVGDTLYITSNGVTLPAFKVENLSSTSCVCLPLANITINVADQVTARTKVAEIKNESKVLEPIVKTPLINSETKNSTKNKTAETIEQKERIKGSFTVNTYSDFSNTAVKNSNQFRYTLSLDAKNISNSNYSVESYISFRHKYGEWDQVKSNIYNALKVYTLSVKYEPNKTTQLIFGRRLNPRISSIGAIDGLQFEKSIKRFVLGAIIGSRPDYSDYSFDSKLFQFGTYIAFNTRKLDNFTESSIAFMEQTNSSKIDRRFLYFQHSNSIVKNLFFFSTLEVDLYKLNIDTVNHTEKAQNTFNPIGFYVSLRYKIGPKITLSGSYDARKNIIYYESYKSLIDRVFETELRQGFRLQASYRITKDLIFGLQSGYRYLKTDPKPSKNAYSYLTYSQIPWLNISATISATYLESNYLKGMIYGTTISREFFSGKLQSSIGYRSVNYNLPTNQIDVIQNIGETSLAWQFSKNMFLSFNYEGTFEKQDRYNRFYFQLRVRF